MYRNNDFVGERLAPAVTVVKESDLYYVYGRQNFRLPASLRPDKTPTMEIGWSMSTDNYRCEEYGYHTMVSDRERENADEPLSIEADANLYLTDSLLLDKEVKTADAILDNTNPEWGNYASTHFSNLDADWDDRANADVRSDFYYARFVIFRDSRKTANQVFLPVEVSYRLAQMEQIDELRKYTDPGLVTNSGLPPTVFGLKVNECQSSYDAAQEGDTGPDFTETFGNNVIITYTKPGKPGLRDLTFATTLVNKPFRTVRWREAKLDADAIQVTHRYDVKIVAPACGFVFTNTITPAF